MQCLTGLQFSFQYGPEGILRGNLHRFSIGVAQNRDPKSVRRFCLCMLSISQALAINFDIGFALFFPPSLNSSTECCTSVEIGAIEIRSRKPEHSQTALDKQDTKGGSGHNQEDIAHPWFHPRHSARVLAVLETAKGGLSCFDQPVEREVFDDPCSRQYG